MRQGDAGPLLGRESADGFPEAAVMSPSFLAALVMPCGSREAL